MNPLCQVRLRLFLFSLAGALACLLVCPQGARSQSVLDRYVDDYVRRTAPTEPEQKKVTNASFKVTITWDTATDVDLWVTEPDGEKCFYQKPRTRNGGVITPDDTQGFGPETYVMTNGPLGEYLIEVNMYAIRDRGATNVNVEIVRDPGTAHQSVQRFSRTLTSTGQTLPVTRLKF